MDPRNVELDFPAKGLDRTEAPSAQPPGTTAEGVNVRLFEPLTGRARGGSRPGLAKYVDDRISGAAAIQHLNTITTVSGEALGWSFEGIDMGDGGIPDTGPAGVGGAFEGPEYGGGGGYNRSFSFQEKRPAITLTVDDDQWPADGTQITIRGTVLDRNSGAPMGGLTVTLSTTPDGEQGDGVTSVSDFLTGAVEWLASKDEPGTVEYGAFYQGTTSRNTVEVSYVDTMTFVQANSIQISSGSTSKQVSFSSPVTAGSLIVFQVAAFGVSSEIDSVTDSQGNTYTRVGRETAASSACEQWYAIAGQTGACTITAEVIGTNFATLACLEYAGPDPTDPFDDYKAATTYYPGDFSTWSTGGLNTEVNRPGGVIVAAFAQGFWDLSDVNFTPAAGWNLRVNQKSAVTSPGLYIVDKIPTTAAATASGTVDVASLSYVAMSASYQPGDPS